MNEGTSNSLFRKNQHAPISNILIGGLASFSKLAFVRYCVGFQYVGPTDVMSSELRVDERPQANLPPTMATAAQFCLSRFVLNTA